MRFGIHLPQAGRQANPDIIMRHAMRAEELGLADLWVSEHIILPNNAPYPNTAIFYEPVVVLSWVAAATRRIGLGTSVLVLPMRHPLPLAKELGTLQTLSNGRLILGAGVGWMEAEFEALGAPFRQRGRRMHEGIALMRAVWSQDPVSFDARYIPAKVSDMRMLPRPSAPIPIWIGGSADRQIERAIGLDGWHGSRLSFEQLAPIIARLRAARPDPDFTISMRVRWDGRDFEDLRARLDRYRTMGVNHVVIDPEDRENDDWDAILEGTARAARP